MCDRIDRGLSSLFFVPSFESKLFLLIENACETMSRGMQECRRLWKFHGDENLRRYLLIKRDKSLMRARLWGGVLRADCFESLRVLARYDKNVF